MESSTPLRRELLYSFALLLGGAVVLAVLGVLVLLPVFDSPAQATSYVAVLLAVDLTVLVVFGGIVLRNRLVRPVEALVEDVHRIAQGDYRHRVRPMDSPELHAIASGVNAMADRLIRDQQLLADNVASLERTNQELVEARSELVRAARLASVGTLAAGLAHEVGNPLGAIVGYVDVARRRAGDGSSEAELLDSIREEADRIDRIVRGLLDYARPRETELAPHPPTEVVDRVRRLLESQGRLEGLEVSWELGDGEVPDVVMQPHRLEQVMVNLLLNAADAVAQGGGSRIRVTLHDRRGDVHGLPRRRENDPSAVDYMHRRRLSRDDGGKGIDPVFTASTVAEIRVEDDGPGVPPEDRDKVFDPLYTTKEPGKGTGLGLYVCARLVEGMGGRMEVGEGAWGGAAFSVLLPGRGADGPVPEPDNASSEEGEDTT